MKVTVEIMVPARRIALFLLGILCMFTVSLMPSQDAHATGAMYKGVFELDTGVTVEVAGWRTGRQFVTAANNDAIGECEKRRDALTNIRATISACRDGFIRHFAGACINVRYGPDNRRLYFGYAALSDNGNSQSRTEDAAEGNLRCPTSSNCGDDVGTACDTFGFCRFGENGADNIGNSARNECLFTCGYDEIYDFETSKCETCPAGQVVADIMTANPHYDQRNQGQGRLFGNTCMNCPAGKIPNTVYPFTYEDRNGDFGRCICEGGTVPDGSGGCTQCGIFQVTSYNNDRVVTCEDCPAGQINDSANNICVLCPEGLAKTGTSGACHACPSGESTADRTACEPCEAGTEPNGSNTGCDACPLGLFNGVAGGSCQQCGANMVSDDDRRACSPCSAGTQLSADRMSCTACPLGTFNTQTNAEAGNSCQACPAGQAPTADGSTCNPCQAGTQLSRNSCIDCPAGMFNTQENAATGGSCQACPANMIQDSDRAGCSLCEAGEEISEDGLSCMNCPGGTFNGTAGGTCQPCPVGTLQNSDRRACSSCSSGEQVSEDGLSCIDCLAGTFNSTAGGSCEPCPAGMVATGPGLNRCTSCQAGQETNADQTACTSCPAGSFNNEAGGSCQACDIGTYATGTGNQTCESCGNGVVTSGGNPVTSGGDACMACPANQMPNSTYTDCVACDPGFGETAEGACVQCDIGTISTEGAGCEPCSEGQTSNADFTECIDMTINCEPNQIPSRVGNTDICVTCQAGEAPEEGNRCTPCPVGHFADAGSTNCSVCAPGTYAGEGSTSCTACPDGEAPNSELSACEACSMGQYAASGDATCKSCPSGETTLTGGASCGPCPQGFSVNVEFACVPSINCAILGANRVPNGLGTSCICASGTVEDADGDCTSATCPAGSGLVATLVKVDGFNRLECNCPSGMLLNTAGNCTMGSCMTEELRYNSADNSNICRACGANEELLTDTLTGARFCGSPLTAAAGYSVEECEENGWVPGYVTHFEGSEVVGYGEICHIPAMIIASSPLAASASPLGEGLPSARQDLSPGRDEEFCVIRADSVIYENNDYLRCSEIFGPSGEFPDRRDGNIIPSSFRPTEDFLMVLPNPTGASEIYLESSTGTYERIDAIALLEASLPSETPVGGGPVTPEVPQGDGGKSSQGVAIGAVAAIGVLTWMLSDGDASSFNWSPEMSLEHYDGLSYYSYGSRIEFENENWTTYWSASQSHVGGEAGDWIYGSGAYWREGILSASLNSRAEGLDTEVSLGMSMEGTLGKWYIVSGVDADWHIDELNSEWDSRLHLRGETNYRGWQLSPSLGFSWEEGEQFGEQTYIRLDILQNF